MFSISFLGFPSALNNEKLDEIQKYLDEKFGESEQQLIQEIDIQVSCQLVLDIIKRDVQTIKTKISSKRKIT